MLVNRRNFGLISFISSRSPIIRAKNEAKRIPKRCLSRGRKIKEVIKTLINIGKPPPRGTEATAVALPLFFCLSKGSSTQFLEVKNLITKGVIKKEIKIEQNKTNKN